MVIMQIQQTHAHIIFSLATSNVPLKEYVATIMSMTLIMADAFQHHKIQLALLRPVPS